MELCKSCNKHEGSPYTFFYGTLDKEFDRVKDVTATNMTVEHVKNYKVEGSKSELICKTCIKRLKYREIIFPLLRLILFPGVVIGIFYLLKIWISRSEGGTFWVILTGVILLVGGILTLVSLNDLIGGISEKKKELGERLALGVGYKELKKESRVFWTETEFLEMKLKELKNRL